MLPCIFIALNSQYLLTFFKPHNIPLNNNGEYNRYILQTGKQISIEEKGIA